MAKQPRENPKHMTKIGGQALIEGVMMKGADTGAVVPEVPAGAGLLQLRAVHEGRLPLPHEVRRKADAGGRRRGRRGGDEPLREMAG